MVIVLQQTPSHMRIAQPIDNAVQQRLQSDVEELFRLSLHDGLTVVRYPTDDRRFCIHVVPVSGHYRGLRLHFTMEVPKEWPFVCPIISAPVHEWNPILADHLSWVTGKFNSTTTFCYTRYSPALSLRELLGKVRPA
jgi:ubiquitin-protein ligase